MTNDAVENDPVADEESGDIVLDAKPTIRDSHQLADQLLNVIEGGLGITIDASQLQSIDTSALQVLVGFVNAADARGIPVQWQEERSELTRIASLCGLQDSLMLHNVAGTADEVEELCPVF